MQTKVVTLAMIMVSMTANAQVKPPKGKPDTYFAFCVFCKDWNCVKMHKIDQQPPRTITWSSAFIYNSKSLPSLSVPTVIDTAIKTKQKAK